VAVFELVIVLLFGGAMLAALARRINVPYPALLALTGAALALLPGTPSVTLDPQLALALFVAPVLLDAAFDSSPRDLRQNWRAVTSLALIAVGLTVAAVAIAVRWVVPDMPWSVAIALGAIVAPPDAAAATAVLRQLRAPHRVFVILEGESLFNDASALLIYRLAVAATITGSFSGWSAIPMLVVVCVGSVLFGYLLSRLLTRVMPYITDVATSVIVQFVSTFGVWIAAERIGLSGIITMVVYAIAVARTAPDRFPARLRIPSYAVWEVVVFVLNVLAFILVGLQLKPILQRLSEQELLQYAAAAAAVCAAVVVIRIVWVMAYALVGRIALRRRPEIARSARYPSYRVGAVIAWCGMRGIVTIAAALALPDGGGSAGAFPYRDLILFTAFCVVLGTLVLQGLTVTPLMHALALRADDTVDREVRLARKETIRAALAEIEAAEGRDEMVTFLRRKYQARLHRTESADGSAVDPADDDPAGFSGTLRRAQLAERRTLSTLRATGVIGDDAFHRVEEELDWAEVNAEAYRGAR
jgi:Na+/H+ antiporter